MRRVLASTLVVALVGPAAAAGAAAAESGVRDLKVVAHLELGAAGPYGAVAVTGATAVVGTGDCPGGPVAVVRLDDPKRPVVAATIPLPPETAAIDVDAASGGVVAIAGAAACGRRPSPAGPAVLLYDVATAGQPSLLARLGDESSSSVSLARRRDGRLIALSAAGGTVRVSDFSNPQEPQSQSVTSWIPPLAGPCVAARLFDEGRRAMVACRGSGVFELDLASPSAPEQVSSTGPDDERVATDATGVLLSDRTLALVSEAEVLRVLELQEQDPAPRELGVVRSPAGQPPGRAVASGELAFVAWHGDGLRVVDVGSPGAPVVARFLPPGPSPDVVGVALLPNHVLVVDVATGLWVIERPEEGRKGSVWNDVKQFLVLLGFASILGFLVVPRLVAGASMIGAPARRPALQGSGGGPVEDRQVPREPPVWLSFGL